MVAALCNQLLWQFTTNVFDVYSWFPAMYWRSTWDIFLIIIHFFFNRNHVLNKHVLVVNDTMFCVTKKVTTIQYISTTGFQSYLKYWVNTRYFYTPENYFLNQLDFWAHKCFVLIRLDSKLHHWYTAAPVAYSIMSSSLSHSGIFNSRTVYISVFIFFSLFQQHFLHISISFVIILHNIKTSLISTTKLLAWKNSLPNNNTAVASRRFQKFIHIYLHLCFYW